ncbi:MAG: vWA domain-containing protein [Fluviicola sp.]
MKRLIVLVFTILFVGNSFSQSNDEIRSANVLVEYMTQSSFLTLRIRTELIQLAEGIEHQEKNNNLNYWHTIYNPNNTITSTNDLNKYYPELEISYSENGKMISFPSSYLDIMYFIVQKYEIQDVKHTKFYAKDLRLDLLKKRYVEINDSIWNVNESIQSYVYSKRYLSDEKLEEAKKLLKIGEQLLKENVFQFLELKNYLAEKYSNEQILKKKGSANQIGSYQSAQVTLTALEKVGLDALKFDTLSIRADLISLKTLTEEARSKDSVYFYNSHFYDGRKYNGGTPAGSYYGFLGHPENTQHLTSVYKQNYNFVTTFEDKVYNHFVLLSNISFDEMNYLKETFDGKKLMRENAYSKAVALKLKIDTAEIILLYSPRWPYTVEFKHKEALKDSVQSTVIKTENLTPEEKHQELINQSKPHNLLYLVDASSSMNSQNKLSLLKESVNYIVKLQRSSDKISLVKFSSSANVYLENTSCANKELIYSKVNHLSASGSSNIYEGLKKSLEIIDNSFIDEGINKILLITDGKVEIDGQVMKLAKQLKKKGIYLTIVLIGENIPTTTTESFTKLLSKCSGKLIQLNSGNHLDALVLEASE